MGARGGRERRARLFFSFPPSTHAPPFREQALTTQVTPCGMFARCYHYGVSRETLLSPLPGKARLTVWRSPMRRVRMMLSLRCQSGNPPATSTGQSPSDNLTQSYAHFVRFSHTIRNLIITRLWILIISPPSQASALIFPLFLFLWSFFWGRAPTGRAIRCNRSTDFHYYPSRAAHCQRYRFSSSIIF